MSCRGSISSRLEDNFKEYQISHKEKIVLPEGLAERDRLNFFKTDFVSFSENLQWQAQAELKSMIKQLVLETNSIRTEYQVLLNEDKIKLMDFLLSAFSLNKILIQTENNF